MQPHQLNSPLDVSRIYQSVGLKASSIAMSLNWKYQHSRLYRDLIHIQSLWFPGIVSRFCLCFLTRSQTNITTIQSKFNSQLSHNKAPWPRLRTAPFREPINSQTQTLIINRGWRDKEAKYPRMREVLKLTSPASTVSSRRRRHFHPVQNK